MYKEKIHHTRECSNWATQQVSQLGLKELVYISSYNGPYRWVFGCMRMMTKILIL